MASAYDKASLVMLPNAYKDGKVYSVKPEDRSGDFTFTRSTAATRVDVNGLIEKGRENLLLQSNQFDTTWGNITTTEFGGQIGYDGSSNAWRINLNAGTTLKAVNQNFTAYSGVSTASFYAKAGAHSIVQFGTASQNNVFVAFDLSSGLVGSLSSEVIDASATSLGNGWYRIQVAYKASGAAGFVIAAVDSLSTTRFSSTSSTGDFYIQDAQLEQGLVATDYIETGASTAQAGITDNVPRLDYTDSSCPALLLEPLRTNLVTQSEYFGDSIWTKTGVTLDFGYLAPDGTYSAYKITDDAGGNTGSLRGAYSLSGTTSRSIWARTTSGTGTLDLLTYFGNTNNSFTVTEEWQRFDVSSVTTSTGQTSLYAVDFRGGGLGEVILWGAQAETGSYPTSYIPTYGSSVSRVAESNSATGVSALIGQSEGTIYNEINFPNTSGVVGAWSISNGSSANRITMNTIGVNATNFTLSIAQNYNSGSTKLLSANVTYGSNHKVAIKYSNTTIKLFIDGQLSGSVSTDGFGNYVNFYIGGNQIGTGGETRNFKQSILFPTALTDSECIALTTI